MRRTAAAAAVLLALPAIASDGARMTYDEAGHVLDALAQQLPADFGGKSPGDIASAWPGWVARRDAEVRHRLERGEEDSLVNLWMYGTGFTSAPRATARDDDVLRARLDDLIAGAARPGSNERLQVARRVLTRNALDPAVPLDRERIRQYLMNARQRMIDEFAGYDRVLAPVKPLNDAGAEAAAYATIFKTRGLASDTSLLADFGVAAALEAIETQGLLVPGTVRRIAIVGPGLDFTNKADGFDFYPQQTIQPFALVDTLDRLGLASPDLRTTTFDLNPRVNEHLRAAQAQARGGRGYVLTLPLDDDEPWSADLRAFWKTLGSRVGEETAAPRPPDTAGRVSVRAVTVRPAVVSAMTVLDLNIVFERLTPMTPGERFDLIVATNVLVYYDVFEQALALANAASMLRPGGLVLTNTAVFPTPPMKGSAGYLRVVYSSRQHDHFFWYQRE